MATKSESARPAGKPVAEAATASSKTRRPGGPPSIEPSEAELDRWAAEERERREAWVRGPTADERAAFARSERERRLAELEGIDDLWAERMRLMRRYPREAQLAAEGAMSLMWKWSRRTMVELVRAGREWEDEFVAPTRRRRIPLDDDTP
jgi:hypothetical protein